MSRFYRSYENWQMGTLMHATERNTLDCLYDLLPTLDPQKRGFCIDAGAGIQDFFGIYFQEWGWPSLIVEPLPSDALLNSLRNRVGLEQAALCAVDDRVTLYAGWDGNTHSLDKDWEQVTGHPHAKTEISVQGIRYETLLYKWGIKVVTCLKLDIEGSELSVIQQLPGCKKKPQVVSLEYGGGFAKSTGQGGWQPERFEKIRLCIDLLRTCGYTQGAHCEDAIHEFTFAEHPQGIWREEAGYGNLVVWQT